MATRVPPNPRDETRARGAVSKALSGNPRRTDEQRFYVAMIMIATAALAVRLLYIFVIARAPVGVGGDASFYHSAANLIADGHFYYRRIFGHAYATALHPPLFSLLLALVAKLGGVHVLPQRIVGCVLGSISAALIARLGHRVGGARTGIIAGTIAAIYPPLITADGALQSEPLYVLLVVVSLLLAYRVVSDSRVWWSALLGGLLGLAVLSRTEAVLLLPLLAWPAALATRHARPLRIAASTIACMVVVAPWVIRNAVVFHRFMLAGNYGTVIPASNCRQTYYGHDIGWWRLDCLARARTHHQLLIGDASPAGGFRYIEHHPGRAVLVAGVRVLRTFSLYQPMRIGNHEPRRTWFDVLGLAIYYPVLGLAVVGVWRLRERRWLLLAPISSAVISTATGWGNPRFRVGADVTLIVLAAFAVSGLTPIEARERQGGLPDQVVPPRGKPRRALGDGRRRRGPAPHDNAPESTGS
jgi:4-amino-4-deoxy-L-arabinose transferase-like glycosyltransferase